MNKKTGTETLIIALAALCLSGVSLFMSVKKEPASNTDLAPQYVMYIGTNDKDTYQPEHTEEEAREIVDNICLKYFGGYTLQEATGSWTDEKENKTHEYTIVCYFDDAAEETVHQAADEIIEALNQNTILIEHQDIQMEYYSGE